MRRIKIFLCIMVLSLSFWHLSFITKAKEIKTSMLEPQGTLQMDLIYEDSEGERYVMPIGSGFLIGIMFLASMIISIISAVAASAIFVSKEERKKKKNSTIGFIPNQKESFGFQPVLEYRAPPSVIPNMTKLEKANVIGKENNGETTVLGGDWLSPSASLWRRKTGKRMVIRKSPFSIGQGQGSDFAIMDNPRFCNVHITIIYQYGAYYLICQDSPCFVYVNGSRLSPNQELRLKSGDRLKLVDEEFEFYV